MSKLSGIRDLDREILGKLEDMDLLKACQIDKYTWNTVCDEAFLRRRLLEKYPKINKEKEENGENESWKQFFIQATHYITYMKKKFGYEYSFGNFVTQYFLLKKYNNKKKINNLLYRSLKKGELALVIWSLNNGAFIHNEDDSYFYIAIKNGHFEVVKYIFENHSYIKINDFLYVASTNGHLEIVKYLVENGADIHKNDDDAFIWTCDSGHLEVVKYLLEREADIHADDDLAIILASRNGHLEVVKYLVERGSDIRAQNHKALVFASENGHLEVVKYLLERRTDIVIDIDEYKEALMFAIIGAIGNEKFEIVKFLIENGADIHADNDLALYTAEEYGNLDMINYLKSKM
jgi:ankyrin repeat protein